MAAMDAYSEMVTRLSNARLADLCREAAADRLAAAVVRHREAEAKAETGAKAKARVRAKTNPEARANPEAKAEESRHAA